MADTSSLAFLHERATDPLRPLAADERAGIAMVRHALVTADAVVVRLGGKAGRLGESIVATALLEGLFGALRALSRADVPLHLMVDAGTAEFFNTRVYRRGVWSTFHVSTAAPDPALDASVLTSGRIAGGRVVWVDLHGAHDGPPSVRSEAGTAVGRAPGRRITTLAQLARTGIRDYAARGAVRRYADFVEELIGLPHATLDGAATQPRIRLSAAALARYPRLARAYQLDSSAIQIVCFFQSVVVAKCYQRWDEVLQRICARIAHRAPERRISFLIACGPEAGLPEGVRQADLTREFADFTGAAGNANVRVAATPSLRDLAVLLSGASLALANDTGPGHLAGALGIPTITPYLPGNLYSRTVWASTLSHRGITLDPNPYSFAQLRDEVLHDRTEIIDSIPPAALADAALAALGLG